MLDFVGVMNACNNHFDREGRAAGLDLPQPVHVAGYLRTGWITARVSRNNPTDYPPRRAHWFDRCADDCAANDGPLVHEACWPRYPKTIQVWSSNVTGVAALGGIVWSNGERAMTKTTDKYTFTFHAVEECEEAIEEIREIIFKTLEDEELRKSFDTPDDDPGPRCDSESPEHAFTRCVAERAASAVLERTTVYKVADGNVSVDLREIGHAEITCYNAEIGSLLEYGDRINIDWMPMATVPRNGT